MQKQDLLVLTHLNTANKVHLSNGWVVEKQLYEKVDRYITDFYPYMRPGHWYRLETIVPSEDWSAMSTWIRIQAGWIASHIAKENGALISKAPSSSATARFERK